MDIEKSVRDSVNWIAERIPGFSGYYKKEKRHEQDRILRKMVVDRMEEFERNVNEKIREISKTKDLSSLDYASTLLKRFEKLKDTIHYAEYGYTGFFDVKEITEDMLGDLLIKDKSLIEWIVNLLESSKDKIDFGKLNEEIEKGVELFKQRKMVIENISL